MKTLTTAILLKVQPKPSPSETEDGEWKYET
jgi:hypothetical protein